MKTLLPTIAVTAALSLTALAGQARDAKLEPELPAVRLPLSGVVDAQPVEDAVVLTVTHDGRVLAASGELYDPASPDPEQAAVPLVKFLAEAAGEMPQKPLAEGMDLKVPAGMLVLRVDAMAEFAHVQHLMERCGTAGVQIWRIEFAVLESKEDESSVTPFQPTRDTGALIHAHLPTDIGVEIAEGGAEPIEKIEVVLRVETPGKRIAPRGDAEGPHVFGDDRRLQYGIGPRKTGNIADVSQRLTKLRQAHAYEDLTIDARAGVTHGEVLEVMQAARKAGFQRILFTGRMPGARAGGR